MSSRDQATGQGPGDTIDQHELDHLLLINGFLSEEPAADGRKSLIDELQDAMLDSGKLSLREWRSLRERLREIERLIPHIDFIIELKSRRRECMLPQPPPAQ